MVLDYSKFDGIIDSDDDGDSPAAAAVAAHERMKALTQQQAQMLAQGEGASSTTTKKKGSSAKRREQEKREQLFDLANDEEIQNRYVVGFRSSHESTEAEVAEAIDTANSLAKQRQIAHAVFAGAVSDDYVSFDLPLTS